MLEDAVDKMQRWTQYYVGINAIVHSIVCYKTFKNHRTALLPPKDLFNLANRIFLEIYREPAYQVATTTISYLIS